MTKHGIQVALIVWGIAASLFLLMLMVVGLLRIITGYDWPGEALILVALFFIIAKVES